MELITPLLSPPIKIIAVKYVYEIFEIKHEIIKSFEIKEDV